MCSEIWHTVVESPLRNVKLLEEKKRVQRILDLNAILQSGCKCLHSTEYSTLTENQGY